MREVEISEIKLKVEKAIKESENQKTIHVNHNGYTIKIKLKGE